LLTVNSIFDIDSDFFILQLAPASVQVDKPENDQSTEATHSGNEEQEGQVEASSGNRTRLATSVVAKPVGRGTTINLADRAKERAALRKVGVSPPSPGARGGRARGARGGKVCSLQNPNILLILSAV
jgi:hypothetical protein